MSFENREIDDKKLMDEIDELESDFEPKVKVKIEEKVEKAPKEKGAKYNTTIIILLILVICAYLCYEKFIKEYNYNNKNSLHETNIETIEKDEGKTKEQITNVETNVKIENDIIIAEIKNNNESPIFDANVYLVHYDENHKAIDISSEGVDIILPNEKIDIEFGNVKNELETFDIVVTKK